MSLEGVRVGDVLASPGFGREISLHRVTAVGKVHVTTDRTKWRIKDGYAAGEYSGWSRPYVRVATPEDLIAHRVQVAERKLKAFAVTPENLEAVEKLLKACQAKTPATRTGGD